MNKRKTKLTLLLLGIALSTAHAQETVAASGGNASGVGGTLSYSVGQVVYTTTSGTNGSVAQGVQQAFEISSVTAIDEAADINLSISAYPNPTMDVLSLNLGTYKGEVVYQLYDTNGKLLESKKVAGTQVEIGMNTYVPALYILKLLEGNTLIKTFKITKN